MYPTKILSHNHYHHVCICVGVGTQQPLEDTVVYQNLTTLMLSTCAKMLKSLNYAEIKSMQAPHTYSVSQPLPSYVHLCRSRHPKNTRTYESITNLTTFMLSTCAKVLESLRYGGIKSMLVRHAYSVSQPLPSPVYIHILFGSE